MRRRSQEARYRSFEEEQKHLSHQYEHTQDSKRETETIDDVAKIREETRLGLQAVTERERNRQTEDAQRRGHRPNHEPFWSSILSSPRRIPVLRFFPPYSNGRV